MTTDTSITFTQAIKKGFQEYFNFSGLSTRSEFWYWVLFQFIISMIFNIIYQIVSHNPSAQNTIEILNFISILILIIPGTAVAARRLHDAGRSGWWLLISLIPLLNLVLIYFYIQPSKTEGNPYRHTDDTYLDEV